MIEKIFKLQENNTTINIEIRSGLTTFLAMFYIVPVNASIMSLAGMPFDALITATACVTIIATLTKCLLVKHSYSYKCRYRTVYSFYRYVWDGIYRCK